MITDSYRHLYYFGVQDREGHLARIFAVDGRSSVGEDVALHLMQDSQKSPRL